MKALRPREHLCLSSSHGLQCQIDLLEVMTEDILPTAEDVLSAAMWSSPVCRWQVGLVDDFSGGYQHVTELSDQ